MARSGDRLVADVGGLSGFVMLVELLYHLQQQRGARDSAATGGKLIVAS
jgi:hypothetical protein